MKDIVTVSVVTFNAAWGDKEKNLGRIKGYVKAAAKQGAHMVLFPEMALTGYDDEPEREQADKMQVRLAETTDGQAVRELAALAREHGLYCLVGMPERDRENPATVYNSIAVFTPQGFAGTYRKMHLPFPEFHWATAGDRPYMVATPWGPMGVSICYDTYCFPEMMRYYAAMGCRMILNCTAYAKCHGKVIGSATLEAGVVVNSIYVASANLGGKDLYNEFWGGSSIIGPSQHFWEPFYYAGQPFTNADAVESEMHTATIDLTLAQRAMYRDNPGVGRPDFRADRYIEMYTEAMNNPDFGK